MARRWILLPAMMLAAGVLPGYAAQTVSLGRTYIVDCNADSSARKHSAAEAILHSLDEVNALQLRPHDSLLFERGTVCHGTLHPQGSGSNGAPITLDATGSGALPRIEADPADEAVLRLFNQDHWSIRSLDLHGGRHYGVYVSGDKGTMDSITMRNLTVSGVNGPLQSKDGGLVIIRPTGANATFSNITLDGIRAFDTTQWAGIFIAGGSKDNTASAATVTHSIVHDVQGDGIVIFNATHSTISRSMAWHTGMEHQQKFGTPNAIWTWQCSGCVVEENEAFLTDSPGVDGGAFDIDWGNYANTVQNNFGHDTQGYCVSVFAANGPTTQSEVSGNLCLANGLSPRLAQRQGAILLMTWDGGTIEGVRITGNRVQWQPAGDTPAIQTGANLKAGDVVLSKNEIHTTSLTLVSGALEYDGAQNRYVLEEAAPDDIAMARKALPDGDRDPVIALEEAGSIFDFPSRHTAGWRLAASIPRDAHHATQDMSQLLLNLKTAAIEFGQTGLKVSLTSDAKLFQAAQDWGLAQDGITLHEEHSSSASSFALKLIAPDGKTVQSWNAPASAIELGLALRHALGNPVYGRLSLEKVHATN